MGSKKENQLSLQDIFNEARENLLQKDINNIKAYTTESGKDIYINQSTDFLEFVLQVRGIKKRGTKK